MTEKTVRRPRIAPGRLLAAAACFLVLAGLVLNGCRATKQELSGEIPNRPAITEYMASPAILVFSGTAGWRHNEGIAGADLFFAELATELGYGFFTTENAAVFNPDDLARFDVIVFNNVTGRALNRDQRRAFEAWMAEGGAWIGLHGSGDGSALDWAWYQTELIGALFIGHTMGPQFQSAKVVSLAADHPVMEGVASEWTVTDEWYSFDGVPDMEGLTVLAGLDEGSYLPENSVVERWPRDLRMGGGSAGHPIIWARCHGGFRAVYSAIGHRHEVYRDATYRRLLTNAFRWVEKVRVEECGAAPDTD